MCASTLVPTAHIPDPFLKAVDQRAKALGKRSGWTAEFLERLRRVESETSAASAELLKPVKKARRSKEPHKP
jgi:hypothetical protein